MLDSLNINKPRVDESQMTAGGRLVRGREGGRTEGLEHLVALIEDEVLAVRQVEVLGLDEREDAARGADEDVRGVVALEDVLVRLDRRATVENGGLDLREVLGEALVLVGDLEGELTGVAHDEDMALAVGGLELVEGGEHEDGGLAHAGLGLADDVHAEDGLRDALVLDW